MNRSDRTREASFLLIFFHPKPAAAVAATTAAETFRRGGEPAGAVED